MTLPNDLGLVRLINVPQVYVLALACKGHLLCVLPLDLKTLELRVDL